MRDCLIAMVIGAVIGFLWGKWEIKKARRE